jgi:phosphoribosylaminoimidazole carboxylase PurE protein
MGSDSDLAVMKDAAVILEELGLTSEMLILSTHRAPEETAKFDISAAARGIKVIIAGAGGAAALPGSIASMTALPVIGVPIESKLQGVDSLHSIVSMPPGVPVATVGINGAKNAGILAAEIIGASETKIAKNIQEFKDKIRREVLAKDSKLQKLGWENYLEEMDNK